MAIAAVSKRCLGGGGISSLLVVVALILSSAVLVAAGDESSYTPDDSGLPVESSDVGETPAASAIKDLLNESIELDKAYKVAEKNAKIAKFAEMGLSGLTGVGLATLIAQAGLMMKNRSVGKARGGIALGSAIAALAALGGSFAMMMRRKKMMKKAAALSASLLKNREEMLEKVKENEAEDTDALVERAEEIANLGDALGLYYPKNTTED